MRLRNVVFGVVAAASVAGAAVAQDATAIANRLDVMKVTVAGAMRPAAMMAMGKQDFDAATAKASMQTIATAMATFPALFPPGSENIKDRAGPAIWTDAAGFKAASDKFAADATAAAAAADQGLDAFKAAFAVVGANCQSCHEKYRGEE